MRLRNSFWALLGQPQIEAPEAVVERVRLAMRRAVEEHLGLDARAKTLLRQLVSAQDIESLWYLRPEIMNAIASRCGESRARHCLLELTALFKGHHPGAATSRLGSL